MEILTGMITSSGVFLLAVWPRYFNRYFGVDTWRILKITDYLRIHKKYPVYLSEQYILQGKFDHPITLSAFLALFPKKWIDKYQWVISPMIEAIHCFVLFLYVYWLTKNVNIALTAQLFYTLTAMVIMESSQLSTRSIGSLFFTLTWLPLMHFIYQGGWLFFLLSLFMVVILTFTHRMSTQVLILLSLLMFIATASPWYLLISILGIGLSWFCFGDKYKRILRGHLTILKYWIKHIDIRYAHQIRGIPQKVPNLKQTDFVRRAEQIFLKLPVISMVGPNIWMSFLFFIPFLTIYSEIRGNILFTIYLWAILLFVLAVATSTIKFLRFMGSGDRYMEYSAFPVAVIASIFFHKIIAYPPFNVSSKAILMVVIITGVLGAIIPIIFMQVKVILRDENRSITRDLWNIIDFLKSIEDRMEIRLACIPHQLADGILYFTDKVKLYLSDSNEHINEMFEKWWPLIKKPLSKTLKDRQITHLLINLNYVNLDELEIIYDIIGKEGPYVLLFIKEG